jgi:SAM-dependent methyltransferase
MSDRAYVRRYFSDHARRWRSRAYDDALDAETFPVGAQRLRLTLEAILERLGSERGHLVDLGCGGGELCGHAANLGFTVTGVDIADGMIAEAEALRQTLPPDAAGRLRLQVGDVVANGLTSAGADAVTAIGLVEYLERDDVFFREAARLLRPGGVLVVSCRNRLFNLASLNDYTRREIDGGTAGALLDEISELAGDPRIRHQFRDFAARLCEGADALEKAVVMDLANHRPTSSGGPPPVFEQIRRQHSPRELSAAALASGFTSPAFVGIHPHPFPPALESVAPRFYNQLARMLEALETSPASLAWSSAFLGVFTR